MTCPIYLEQKVMSTTLFQNRIHLEKCFNELIAFLKSQVDPSKHQFQSISKEADLLWHQFILFTREYEAFCKENFGEFIHHSPSLPQTPYIKLSIVC